MVSRRLHPLLALLLIWTQLVAYIAGPGWLVNCRLSDGSSHVELANVTCSVFRVTSGSVVFDNDDDRYDDRSGYEDWTCTDEAYSHDQLVPGRHISRTAEINSPTVISQQQPLSTGGYSGCYAVKPAAVKLGPPEHIARSLRATVLNL